METLYTIWGALVGLSVLVTGVAYLMVKRADAEQLEVKTLSHPSKAH